MNNLVKYEPPAKVLGGPKDNFEKSVSSVVSIILFIILSISKIIYIFYYFNTHKLTNIFVSIGIIMKDSLIKQCLDILQTQDVRNEIKRLFSPVTDLILYEIYPYIYAIIFLVFLIFILILAILIILINLLRNKSLINAIV